MRRWNCSQIQEAKVGNGRRKSSTLFIIARHLEVRFGVGPFA
jgi:hypothetical protein